MRVYSTSAWIPPEWVRAHELEYHGVGLGGGLGGAGSALRAGQCAFAQAALSLAEREAEAAFVFSTHCDQLRRSFDHCRDRARVFLFHLPVTCPSAAAERMFLSELERLSRFLVRVGGQAPSPARLAETVEDHRQAREQLLRLQPTVSACDFLEAVGRFFREWDGSVRAEAGSALPASGVPLAILGGPMNPQHWPILQHLEKRGARIVLNAVEPGERHLGCTANPGTQAVDARSVSSQLAALSRSWLSQCVDVYQRPNDRLYAWLGDRLRVRGVRGILLWSYVWCDLWRAEAQTLRETFNLPVLPLDAEGSAAGQVRCAGRLDAFLEALT